jgi:tRNA-specific 2-thiouridylase
LEETEDDGACTAQADYEDAKSVCFKLGIPFYSVNFSKEYWDNVFTYFLKDMHAGARQIPTCFATAKSNLKHFWIIRKKYWCGFDCNGTLCADANR